MPKLPSKGIIALDADVNFIASEGEAKGPRRFRATAYTGGKLQLPNFDLPVVVDLDTLQTRKNIVANLDHDVKKRVGNVDSIENDGKTLVLAGNASAATPSRDEVIQSADDGFNWQASIEARPTLPLEKVPAAKGVKVNGQIHAGPLYVARNAVLRGFAFVSHGADDDTTVQIAAEAAHLQEAHMDPAFEAYLTKHHPNHADMQAAEINLIEATWKTARQDIGSPEPQKKRSSFADIRAEKQRELDRQDAIKDIAASMMDQFPTAMDAIADATEQALGDKAIQASDFKLRMYEETQSLSKPVPPTRRTDRIDARMIEAAMCMTIGLPNIDKHFDPQTIEAAERRFHGGIGLAESLQFACAQNGHLNVSPRNVNALLRGAFDIKASGGINGFSTVSLPGILSNVANKVLLDSFNAVRSEWRDVSSKRSVKDFKEITAYSLTGAFTYEKVGPGGEIPHKSPGEQTYTNRAETYAAMSAITRQDIINDDMGALQKIPAKLGRGGAVKLNEVFWAEFLADHTTGASIFPTDASKGNYIEGATTVVGNAGLQQALTKFRTQTDPDGKPLAVEPRILLVPPGFEADAYELFMATNINTGGSATTTKVANRNFFAGRYRPVVSEYLANSAMGGGYSATAWYLLADPMDLSFIEVCFLNGRETPVIESADADFNVLGIQFRGYHDFGVNKQEYRAAVKSKGAA